MENKYLKSYRYLRNLKMQAVEGQYFEFASDLRELERETFMMPKVFEFTYAREADFDIEVFHNKLQQIFQKFCIFVYILIL